jgi:hypothetical protein
MIETDVLIPPTAGKGMTKRYHQQRTLFQYTTMCSIGLWAFWYSPYNSVRVIGLGLFYPGAGFLTVATLPAMGMFVLSQGLFALSLYAWYILGGTFLVIASWLLPALAAGIMAGDALFNQTGVFVPLMCIGGIGWSRRYTSELNATASAKAHERNRYLIAAVQDQLDNIEEAPSPRERELDLETLRHLQFIIERGSSPKHDYRLFDVIDQFQLCALRYQLYSVVDVLSVYQCHYVPGFHGYVSKASRNCIEKSLQEHVLS